MVLLSGSLQAFSFPIVGFILRFFAEGLLKLAQKAAAQSKTSWDDQILHAIGGPIGYCVASGFWFMSLYLLRLEGAILQFLSVFVQFVFSVSVIWIFYRMAELDGISCKAKRRTSSSMIN